MAAFQTLLYAYTRQDKLAVGTIVSNRRSAQSDQIIGSFANTLLIAANFAPGVGFRGLVEQLAVRARDANANQYLPFERLLGELNRSLTENPLFRVMFVLHQHQAMDSAGLQLAGTRVHKLADVRTLRPTPPAAAALAGYKAPVSDLERAVCRIWEKLFGIDRVGVADRFDDLGGHSLLALRMPALVEAQLGVKLPPAPLDALPTVEAIAAHAAANG